MQIICSDREQIYHSASPIPWGQKKWEHMITKGHKGEGFVHYFHYGAKVTVVYKSKLIELYTLTCAVYYISAKPQQSS